MAADLREAATKAANALIAHLRERPEDAKRNPTELAEKLGLSPVFVSSVLESAATTPNASARREPPAFRVDFGKSVEWAKRMDAQFDALTANPMPLIIWSTVLCILACQLLSMLAIQLADRGLASVGTSTAVLGVMFFTLCLHITCYFRQNMTRYALQGGLFIWVVISVIFTVLLWREEVTEARRNAAENAHLMDRLLFNIAVTAVVASVYTGIGLLATIFGGWSRMRKEQRHEEQMSRQQLLERYFELQDRLENCVEPEADEPFWRHWWLVQTFLRSPRITSCALGLLMGIPAAVFFSLPTPSNTLTASAFFLLTLRGAFGLTAILGYVFIGFFSRNGWAAIGNAVLGRVAALLTIAIPIRYNHSAEAGYLLSWYVGASVVQVGIAWAAQVGARVQASEERSESLRRNDQATIVAEMLRIQWRLSDHRAIVCVLVVDASRSSEMKANADPLAVEYSFREYQAWIENICVSLGGRVHSTAGDGAVASFDNCLSAFRAARRLQTDVSRLNREVNRLKSPFRLRVGLHVGQVTSDIDEVVFTEVIDIAAHVQSAAPVSGIAATDDVVMALEGEEFVPLARTIDGHGVSLALNPVEDP